MAEGESEKFQKTLERKLVRDVSKDPRKTAKSLVNDLAKSGTEEDYAYWKNGIWSDKTKIDPFDLRHVQEDWRSL